MFSPTLNSGLEDRKRERGRKGWRETVKGEEWRKKGERREKNSREKNRQTVGEGGGREGKVDESYSLAHFH